MLDKLLTIPGRMQSAVSGIFGISDEQKRYLASGWRCPHCNARLMNLVGVGTAKYYSADGKRLWISAALRADTLGCPECGHRWKHYGNSQTVSAPTVEILGIVETERSEEFFGEDRRVIDNAKSATQLTRSFSFSKEWSKSCRLDFERLQGSGGELTIGSSEAAALKLSSEESVRRAYSVSEETKETSVEEVTCQIPAHTKLTVVVRWKRIWQHGLVQAAQGALLLNIPFRVAVGMTFDQQQIDEAAAGTSG